MKHKGITISRYIAMGFIISIGISIGFISLIVSCGIVAPNVATLIIISDADNPDDSYVGIDLKEVIVNYDASKKATINRGNSETFQVQWWGENQQKIPVSYYTERVIGVKTYVDRSFSIRNFDTMNIHVGYNANQGPEIEKK